MKKNAALIAGIMFVAAGASTYGQSATQSSSHSSHSSSFEHGTGVAVISDVSADSSIRGGSLDARGYHQDENNDELESAPKPINPGKQADSSIRGGSVYSRERNWNSDAEPSSGRVDSRHHLKADSSVRGGSVEARGAREAASSGYNGEAHMEPAKGKESRDDFGQGSSSNWGSDKGYGSVRGSANWNPSDDLLRDGVEGESETTTIYDFNNDASVGGSAGSESGTGGSSIDGGEIDSEGYSTEKQSEIESSQIQSDLNSSEQLESNISGEIDLNSRDTSSAASSSLGTTDIHHDESELNSPSVSETKGVGTAVSAEVGASSSESEFKSNDPALDEAGSPLGTSGREPNFLYQDNRAHGVGSATSGEFATSPVNQGVGVQSGDEQLARQVKARLVQESTGTHRLMMHQAAKDVQVTSKDGELTLTGTVPSEQTKDMVEVRAREVDGVKRVQNNLMVAAEAERFERGISRGSDLEDVTRDLQDE
jgi:hypothetical protein